MPVRLAITIAIDALTHAVEALGKTDTDVVRRSWALALLSVADELEGLRRLAGYANAAR